MGYAGYRIHLAHVKNRELQERLLRSEYNVELLSEAVLKEDNRPNSKLVTCLIPTKRLQENHIYLVTKVDEDVVYVSYKNKKSSAYASAIAGWINEGKYIHVPVKK
jgi:hypothetical protein